MISVLAVYPTVFGLAPKILGAFPFHPFGQILGKTFWICGTAKVFAIAVMMSK
jgi:hypothetical protein